MSTMRKNISDRGYNVQLVVEDTWMDCLFVRDQWELVDVLCYPIDFVTEEMIDMRAVVSLREMWDVIIQGIGQTMIKDVM